MSEPLTMKEVLDIAASGFEHVSLNYDPDTGQETDDAGDTLALFVVRELSDCCDPDNFAGQVDARGAQLEQAMKVMLTAIHDLENVYRALSDAMAGRTKEVNHE